MIPPTFPHRSLLAWLSAGALAFAQESNSKNRTAAESTPTAPARAGFKQAGVTEFDALRAQPNAYVLDVRTSDEFAAGHLPHAGHLDIMGDTFAGTLPKLDRSKLYLVNCAAGGRSARACQKLNALGFTNVVNLEGGFTAWKQAKPDAISTEPPIALPLADRATMRLHPSPTPKVK